MDLIELTPSAKEKIKALKPGAIEQGNSYLRLGTRGGGCGVAITYYLGFDKAEEGDQIFSIDGIDCIVNKGQLMQIQGVQLDYLETESEKGFKFLKNLNG